MLYFRNKNEYTRTLIAVEERKPQRNQLVMEYFRKHGQKMVYHNYNSSNIVTYSCQNFRVALHQGFH